MKKAVQYDVLIRKVVADAMKKNTPGAKALRLRNEEIYGKTKRSSAAPPVEPSRQNKKKKALPERTSGGGGKPPNYLKTKIFHLMCICQCIGGSDQGCRTKGWHFLDPSARKVSYPVAEAFLRP
jgi:hypothetical protein